MPHAREAASPAPASAIATLIQCFAEPLAHARARHADGARVIGTAAHTVPWELLRAAGFSPVIGSSDEDTGAACDEFLEPGVFSPRSRGLFESVLAGDLSFLSALVFARTSEQDYKTYLYLREVAREGNDASVPPLWFYDLLHSPSTQAYDYGLARTRELLAQLEAAAGRAIHEGDLEAAIEESNAARAAARRVAALRSIAAPRGGGGLAAPRRLLSHGSRQLRQARRARGR